MPAGTGTRLESISPIPTLLIGGPKHGEWLDQPYGVTTYDFTEPHFGRPWPESREYTFHVYSLDPKLTVEMLNGGYVGRGQVFIHDLIAGERHGSQFKYKMDKLTEEMATAKTRLEKDLESMRGRDAKLRDRDATIKRLNAELAQAHAAIGRHMMKELHGGR